MKYLKETILNCLAKLSPESLLSRLILIFSFSFLVFLILTAIYAEESRHFYFRRGLMADHARRMAESTVLLDMSPQEIRPILRRQFNDRYFKIFFSKTPPEFKKEGTGELKEASILMKNFLNLSLSRLYEGPKQPMPKPNELPQRAKVIISELNMPSPLDSFIRSLQSYFSQRPPKPPKERKQAVFHAIAAIPMHDGTWTIIEDTSPGYPPIQPFPIKGILSIEAFFVIVCIFAFIFCVRPLRRLAKAADSFGRDIPGTPPLEEKGPSEVREAAQAFNRMQKSIRNFVEERERMLAAVSHDLRTPLTRMRLRVEQLDEEKRIPLQRDIGELQQIMDTTIDIARSRTEEKALLDIGSLLETLVEDRQDMGMDIRLSPRLEDPEILFSIPPLNARPLSVKRCLTNLMDNALRYGTQVIVDVQDNPKFIAITVSDNGPGIPEQDLEKVFQPFFREEPSRNRNTGGTGLGLSISRQMARLHDGDVILKNKPEGGLLATATFSRV